MENSIYDYIGLTKEATNDEIKNAYKRLARQWHPDKTLNKDDTKFKELSRICDILLDAQKRIDYECFGDNIPVYNQNNDLWELELPLKLEELYLHMNDSEYKKEHIFNYNIDCQKCINKIWDETNPCNECKNGKIYLLKKIHICPDLSHIEIKLPNRNYLLLYKLVKHKHFELIENSSDLLLKLDVPLFKSLTYTYLFRCEFLDGSELIIQPDLIINPNEKYIIKGYGMSKKGAPKGDQKGDLNIEFNLIFPKTISEKKCEYLRKIFKLERVDFANEAIIRQKIIKKPKTRAKDKISSGLPFFNMPPDFPQNCIQQ